MHFSKPLSHRTSHGPNDLFKPPNLLNSRPKSSATTQLSSAFTPSLSRTETTIFYRRNQLFRRRADGENGWLGDGRLFYPIPLLTTSHHSSCNPYRFRLSAVLLVSLSLTHSLAGWLAGSLVSSSAAGPSQPPAPPPLGEEEGRDGATDGGSRTAIMYPDEKPPPIRRHHNLCLFTIPEIHLHSNRK
uniref:Uncharacterized protein n=1 Tax=Angiostrongylus cantonensis TaxID=6313 RepID=A0A0K0D4B3_ANGCA